MDDAAVDQEILEALENALHSYEGQFDQAMTAVWREYKMVWDLVEGAEYHWDDRVDQYYRALQNCHQAAAAMGASGDCWIEQNNLSNAEEQLAHVRATKRQLASAERLMQSAEKRYRYFLDQDHYRSRQFLLKKAEIVARYRGSQMPTAGGERNAGRIIADAALTGIGAVALGVAFAAIAANELAKRRDAIAHSPASGAREVAALVGDGRFSPTALPNPGQNSGPFKALFAEPAAGLLLASRTVPTSPAGDQDVEALARVDPGASYRVAIVATPDLPDSGRLFARGVDGQWAEILADQPYRAADGPDGLVPNLSRDDSIELGSEELEGPK